MHQTTRKADYPINPLILNRWSPRAMNGESIDDQELMSLFEAARWAPSSYNAQPWRFIYAKKDSSYWQTFFDLLIDFNQSWCKNASVLGVIIAQSISEKTKKPSITHSFDTGAAWENLALQANDLNLVVHGMQGFDYERAKQKLHVPDEYEVLAMFALGKPGPKEVLSQDLQQREVPSGRKPISEFVFEGTFR